jgi:hypothetical protein
MTTNYFSLLSFVAVFGSGIRDPGWEKKRIRETSRIRKLWSIRFWIRICIPDTDPAPGKPIHGGSGFTTLDTGIEETL